MANSPLAITYFKKARAALPRHAQADSLLPIVVDYSLAQALLVANHIDMELEMTPTELLAHVFERLRAIVLRKREESILAQCFLMLGTCAVYSEQVSRDVGELYLESARTQILTVPADVCFYSCVTKELLSRDEFVDQIDYYADQLHASSGRRR
jgi:hypothetical protein